MSIRYRSIMSLGASFGKTVVVYQILLASLPQASLAAFLNMEYWLHLQFLEYQVEPTNATACKIVVEYQMSINWVFICWVLAVNRVFACWVLTIDCVSVYWVSDIDHVSVCWMLTMDQVSDNSFNIVEQSRLQLMQENWSRMITLYAKRFEFMYAKEASAFTGLQSLLFEHHSFEWSCNWVTIITKYISDSDHLQSFFSISCIVTSMLVVVDNVIIAVPVAIDTK